MKYLILLLPFTASILESSLISFPLFLVTAVVLFLLTSFQEKELTLNLSVVAIFISSLILDSLRLQHLGLSALFTFTIFFIIHVYNKTFEIKDIKFSVFAIIGSVIIYSMIAGYNVNLDPSLIIRLTYY